MRVCVAICERVLTAPDRERDLPEEVAAACAEALAPAATGTPLAQTAAACKRLLPWLDALRNHAAT